MEKMRAWKFVFKNIVPNKSIYKANEQEGFCSCIVATAAMANKYFVNGSTFFMLMKFGSQFLTQPILHYFRCHFPIQNEHIMFTLLIHSTASHLIPSTNA